MDIIYYSRVILLTCGRLDIFNNPVHKTFMKSVMLPLSITVLLSRSLVGAGAVVKVRPLFERVQHRSNEGTGGRLRSYEV